MYVLFTKRLQFQHHDLWRHVSLKWGRARGRNIRQQSRSVSEDEQQRSALTALPSKHEQHGEFKKTQSWTLLHVVSTFITNEKVDSLIQKTMIMDEH